MASKIPTGVWKGRGIIGSQQFGKSGENNTPQLAIALRIRRRMPNGIEERTVQTFLPLTQRAIPFSIERLRALGWKGTDIRDLAGIDQADVDVDVAYEDFQGEEQLRVEILTGAGFSFDKARVIGGDELATLAKFVEAVAVADTSQAGPPSDDPRFARDTNSNMPGSYARPPAPQPFRR